MSASVLKSQLVSGQWLKTLKICVITILFSFFLDLKHCQWSVWFLRNLCASLQCREVFHASQIQLSPQDLATKLWCVDHSQQLSPHTTALTPLPQHDGEGNQESKSEKNHVSCDKDSLVGKAKTVSASEAKQRINSLVAISGQMFSHFQARRASSRITVGKTMVITPNITPSSFVLWLLLLSMTSDGMKYPISQLQSAVPVVSTPNLLPTHSLLAWGTEWEKEGWKKNLHWFSRGWGQCEKKNMPRYCASTAQ